MNDNGEKRSSLVTKIELRKLRSGIMKQLSILLKELSQEKWCPVKVTIRSLEEGLTKVANVFANSGAKIISELCGYLSEIYDVCRLAQVHLGEM